MQNVKILVSLITFLTLNACGTVETLNVGAPEDEKTEEKSDLKNGEEETEVVVETTTSTKVTINGKGESSSESGRQEVARYELVNDNRANTEFVGANYCAGSSLRDCWIRSGFMTEYSDGSYSVSIEFWDTYEAQPYTVEEEEIEDGEERAIMLTDKAKSLDDETVSYKMLWAIVMPAEKGIAVIYDWGNDGPNVQGDDMLDALRFEPIQD